MERVAADISPRDRNNMVAKELKAIFLVMECTRGTRHELSGMEPDTQKVAA